MCVRRQEPRNKAEMTRRSNPVIRDADDDSEAEDDDGAVGPIRPMRRNNGNGRMGGREVGTNCKWCP